MEKQPIVLLFTDGSAHSPALYHHAAWAAARLRARVEIVHVLDHHREAPAAFNLSGAIGINATDEVTRELVELEAAKGKLLLLKGKAVIDDAKRQMRELGVEEIQAHVRHGNLIGEIEEAHDGTAMILMGKNGTHEGGARGHLGSNLQRGIKSSRIPVLVTSREFRPTGKFLLAYDGGPSAMKIMAFLEPSDLLKGCECHLLRTGHLDDKARWYASEAGDQLRRSGYQVQTHLVEGRADEMILRMARDLGVDMVVMGAYGHSPIRHLMMGSTTTSVLLKLDLPVLLFR